MTVGAWVLIAALAAALALGLWRLASDGRFRGTHPIARDENRRSGEEITDVRHEVSVLPADQLGERATLLQFSSAFCAPCRATRRTLADVAARVPGVVHVEVDAESHLELVRRLGVLRTPTTLVLDADGREVNRASGAPRPDQVIAAIGEAVS